MFMTSFASAAVAVLSISLLFESRVRICCRALALSATNLKNPCNSLSFSLNGRAKPQHATSLFAVMNTNVMAKETLITRRDVATLLGVVLSVPSVVHASGGATAGGAYLLSAKQRYNKRVIAGIKSFLSLSSSLESGSLEATKSFFTSEEEGAWKDTAIAGYLLANAFRKSSATPPDSLPAVKKWKAFKANVGELYNAAVTKNNVKEAAAAYANAQKSLNDYLEAVELPPPLEL